MRVHSRKWPDCYCNWTISGFLCCRYWLWELRLLQDRVCSSVYACFHLTNVRKYYLSLTSWCRFAALRLPGLKILRWRHWDILSAVLSYLSIEKGWHFYYKPLKCCKHLQPTLSFQSTLPRFQPLSTTIIKDRYWSSLEWWRCYRTWDFVDIWTNARWRVYVIRSSKSRLVSKDGLHGSAWISIS